MFIKKSWAFVYQIVPLFLNSYHFLPYYFSKDVFKQQVINQNVFLKIEMIQKSFVTLVFMNKNSNKYYNYTTFEGYYASEKNK